MIGPEIGVAIIIFYGTVDEQEKLNRCYSLLFLSDKGTSYKWEKLKTTISLYFIS